MRSLQVYVEGHQIKDVSLLETVEDCRRYLSSYCIFAHVQEDSLLGRLGFSFQRP